MYKKNTVAYILFIIGCGVFVIGFFSGFLFGGFFLSTWIGSFLLGMFFIALAEIITILEDNRAYARAQLDRLNLISGYEEKVEETVQPALRMDPELSERDQNLIKELYERINKPIKEIFPTPVEDYAFVLLETGEYELVELGGFRPYIIPKDNWNPQIKKWFDENY